MTDLVSHGAVEICRVNYVFGLEYYACLVGSRIRGQMYTDAAAVLRGTVKCVKR